MEADLQAYVAFYLTGKKQPAQLDEIADLNLCPALFSAYRDLTRLRYDFPLVLIEAPADGRFVEPLSGLIDGILSKVANGPDGERIRKNVLILEESIRARVSNGASGLFSKLWDQTAPALARQDKLMADSLARARANLKIDGELIDCSEALSFRLFAHAWTLTQKRRAANFNEDVERLILKLSDIIQADFINSDAGKSAENLKHSFGSGPLDSFNFDAMSNILKKVSARKKLDKNRRHRILGLISALRSQRFFPTANAKVGTATAPYPFAYTTCSGALKAYRERLPKAIELARTIAVAELEIKGEYSESRHDALFESFGENGLDAQELAIFPDYLVRLNATTLSGPEQSTLTEILSADLPIKILVQTDDVIEESLIGNNHLAFALRSKQLATMAMGMNGVFVLQSPASCLYQLREQIQRGLDYAGTALFSVYSGASANTASVPPYLVAAAALESRVFPAFSFDPSAGRDWASRFSLAVNTQPENDWPVRDIVYQDERQQTVAEATPFTLIDFVTLDSRYGKHFARVPRARWSDALTPVAQTLASEGRGQIESVPYLTMVDSDNLLQRVIVDEKLIREARRCKVMWNSLQELGGIHNSHAEKRLASEKKAWDDAARASSAQAPAMPGPAASATGAAIPAASEPEAERSSDEAYIETPRCSTCNECVQLNKKMFAYDGNKQAYIADISAGTYAQLVEAAENCQVSIIHPGKPRNANEAGLDELLKRAEAFM